MDTITNLNINDMRTIEEVQDEISAFKGKKTTKGYRALKKELSALEELRMATEDVGLGDVVESITKATGIKAIVDKVSGALGFDCGCDERKDKLNKIKLFSKKRVINCPTKDELIDLKESLDGLGGSISRNQQVKIISYYNSIFQTNQKVTSCSSCIKRILDELRLYIKTIE